MWRNVADLIRFVFDFDVWNWIEQNHNASTLIISAPKRVNLNNLKSMTVKYLFAYKKKKNEKVELHEDDLLSGDFGDVVAGLARGASQTVVFSKRRSDDGGNSFVRQIIVEWGVILAGGWFFCATRTMGHERTDWHVEKTERNGRKPPKCVYLLMRPRPRGEQRRRPTRRREAKQRMPSSIRENATYSIIINC